MAHRIIKNKRERNTQALFRAVQRNDFLMVRFLLKQDSCSEIRDIYGNGLLHLTAISGNSNIICRLLKHGYDANAQNQIGDTALNFAIRFNKRNVVEILLKNGANLKIKNSRGEYPLYCAVSNNNVHITKMLLDHGAIVHGIDDFHRTALHLAICRNQSKIVKLLVGYGNQINNTQCGRSPLHVAVGVGDESIVTTLLEAGADVNIRDKNGFSTLQYAIKARNVALAKFLIEKGANVNNVSDTGVSPLQTAVLNGDEHMVALFLEHGADICAKMPNGETVLHIAAMENANKSYINILKCLLNRKCNVNEPNEIGETPFHIILENGNIQLVRLFMKYGVDIKAKDHDGRTALHFAAKNGDKRVLEMILDIGVLSIEDRTNSDGATPLHIAAKFAKPDCIEILLQRGGDVNCPDLNGNTPIFYAAEQPINYRYDAEMVTNYRRTGLLLLKLGANVNHETVLNETVLDLLIEERNTIMTEVVIEHLALMEARGLSIIKTNYELIKNYEYIMHYFELCQKELMKMKKLKVYGRISFFNILVGSVDVVAAYARNSTLVKAFEEINCGKNFPIYSNLLSERFQEGVNKQNIMASAANILCDTLRFADPEYIAYEIILKHLSIRDMQTLIRK